MKATCAIEKLKNAVSTADKMTGKNLTLPVLHSILLVAQKTSIVIRSTNLAVGIELEIPAKVELEGSVVVKGDILTQVCASLNSAQEVTLSLENNNLTLTTLTHTTTITSLPSDEFPVLPQVEGDQFEIKTPILADGIRSVSFAAAISEIKPEIASVYIYGEEGTLYLVATDSFRLAEKKIQNKHIPDISKLLIPFKNIGELLRALDAAGDMVVVSYNKNQVSIQGKGVYFTSRLIDGGFPPYHLIIPKEETTKVVVMKQELLSTLKLSNIFADKFMQVMFTVDPHTKKLIISSKNSDIGSSESVVDAVIQGKDIQVVCNLKYFLDVFQALSGDSVSLSFTEPNKPIVVRSVSDTSFLYLLMPANR